MLYRDEVVIVIYFFYGLAFYSLGLALLVESGRASQLEMARSFRLLAAFGLLHGTHEWIDMFERGGRFFLQYHMPLWVSWVHVVIMLASFLALLAFGERLLRHNQPPRYWRLTLGAILWFSLSAIAIRVFYRIEEREWATASDVLGRYILAVPGALLTALALWRQRRIFMARGLDHFVPDLTIAAVAIGMYGVPGQLFPRESVVFPSPYINDVLFMEKFGFPVQFLRAGIATVVAVAMIRVLRALEVENQQHVLAIEQARFKTEQRSREALKLLNHELQQANEETRRLLVEVQQRDARRGELLQRSTHAQEAERQRIARELHDETGQSLTALAMGLRGLIAALPPEDNRIRQLTTLQEMATNAVGQLRHMINDLRPPQLDDMGLIAALRWLVKTLQERSQIAMTFEVSGTPLPLRAEVETTLFRIAQESLNNVIKHAQASQVRVVLDFQQGVTLTVEDNGVGFEAATALSSHSTRTSWGLLGIQERAHLIHATFNLQSQPGAGTQVTIQVIPPADEGWGKRGEVNKEIC